MIDEREEQTHPSYGQIRFTRTNCSSGQNFYGSELDQDHYITMTVQQSYISRELTKDWYFTKGLPLIEVRMSSGQFAELITSLNQGSGTPCTVEWVGQQKVEDFPIPESRKEFVHRKFEDRMKQFAEQIRKQQQEAKDLVKKKTLNKEEMNRLKFLLNWLTQEIEQNIPFFIKCFQETADQVVFEAKLEVENAIQHKINVLGLEALHEQQKLLKND